MLFNSFLESAQKNILVWHDNFLVIGVIGVVEIIFPARKLNFNQNINRFFLGSTYLLLNIIFIYPLIEKFSIILTTFAGRYPLLFKHKLISINFLQIQGFSQIALFAIATAIYWISWDFIQYWIHRLLHSRYFFWLHEHHHNTELDLFGSFRHSPIELLFIALTIGVPASLYIHIVFPQMGVPKLITYVLTFIVLIQHSNIKFGWPINYIFITPQMHRIHHSLESGHWNHNFSQYFTLWDYLFKTLYIPKINEFPETGDLLNPKKLFYKFFIQNDFKNIKPKS